LGTCRLFHVPAAGRRELGELARYGVGDRQALGGAHAGRPTSRSVDVFQRKIHSPGNALANGNCVLHCHRPIEGERGAGLR